MGILLSANRWIRLITNHLAERITARVDTKWVMPLVLLVSALLCVIYGLEYPFPAVLGARLLWGLCWSFLRQIGIMTSVGSTVTSEAGKSVGYYTGISRIGSIAGCFIGALLFDISGYRSTFIIFGILTLLGIPLGYASQKNIQVQKPGAKPKAGKGGNGNTALLVFFGFVVGCVGPGLVMSTLGFILKDQFGGHITTGTVMVGIATINGFLLAVRHIIGTLGAPFFGAFVDRIGHRKGAFICFTASTFTLFTAMAAQGLLLLLSAILLFFISSGHCHGTALHQSSYPRGKSICLLCHSFRLGGGCRSNCWMDASRIHFDTDPLLCPRWYLVCRGHAFFNTAIESLHQDKLDRIYRMYRIELGLINR